MSIMPDCRGEMMPGAAFKILEQLFGARFAGLRIFFDAGFVSRFRSGFAHGEKRAEHEKEQKQQQGEGEG